MSSPTQRSLEKLRAEGYTCQVVEHWNPHVRRRQDLFGFCDIVAIKPSARGVMFVQTTSGSCVSARVKKLNETAAVGIALAGGNTVIVHGWAKRGPRGKRKVWTCREVNFSPDPMKECERIIWEELQKPLCP